MISSKFLKKMGMAAALAASVAGTSNFATSAFAQEAPAPIINKVQEVSLEHLVEKTLPDFIISGYNFALNPTEENKAKYNTVAQQLRQEEQTAESKGYLLHPLLQISTQSSIF